MRVLRDGPAERDDRVRAAAPETALRESIVLDRCRLFSSNRIGPNLHEDL